jgi:cell division protein FtsB
MKSNKTLVIDTLIGLHRLKIKQQFQLVAMKAKKDELEAEIEILKSSIDNLDKRAQYEANKNSALLE